VSSRNIFRNFHLTNDEYAELCKKFQDLCRFASWQLIRKNVRNNHTDEMEDIEQDLLIAVIRAGVYYKRQVYIEDCLRAAKKYAKDSFMINLVKELKFLWKNRTKHGANKQKYGEMQERILESIVQQIVPEEKRPDKNRKLTIDKKFTTYSNK